MTKKVAIISIGIFIISAFTAFAFLSKTQPTSQIFTNLLTTEENDTITIIGVGDIMLGTNYPSTAYLPPNDGKDLLTPVINILKNADVTFGNLEGTLLDKGGYVKNCSDPSKCYAFRMPERYAKYLTEAGFDVVSIANNHVRDFGQPGLKKTIETLQNEGIHFAGLETHPSTIFEINGVKYGFCAFAPNSGTVKINDYEQAEKIVKELEMQSDIVILSFHGGAEGSKHRHVTKKTEYFYGENRGNVHEFAHKMIDAGADVIFGHGPHITRAVEVYKGRFIAYSLGNFCTYARFNLSGSNGIAPIVKLKTDKQGRFLAGKIFPVIQTGEGGPKPDSENRAIKEIIELTNADLNGGGLTISDSGIIKPAE